ncbi:unnamed protein product [Echinostoma caproni]|uniref:PRA1 family protein n=1 Tax=Echinostoma caproni TaxID=27848 RepID=A0A183BFU7_9TREM|nr:unnamed protein product [Echinostoma caproni]
MKTVPLRSFQEFLGSSARFGVPTDASWRNRLLANLVYYQSNYFLIIIHSFRNPTSLVVGLGITCIPLVLFMLADISPQTVRNPKVALPVIIALSLLLLYSINHLIFFLVAILIPCLGKFASFSAY